MSPEEQRIAIAEACGSKWQKGAVGHWKEKGHSYEWVTPEGQKLGFCYLGGRTEREAMMDHIDDLPDYLSDLNACAEMEKAIKDRKSGCLTYCTILAKICGCDCLLGGFEIVTATAPQRCEAFLRTINE